MDVRYLFIFLSGLIGGFIALAIGAPLPFLLGGFFGASIFVLFYERENRQLPKMSKWVRLIFVSIIGTLIGSRFTPELIALLPQFWISGIALVVYTLVATAGGYAIMRKMAGYDSATALYSSLPGGLIDSISLAEENGADVRIVTAQHFIRIVIVVVTVPLLFWIIGGTAVGSAAGQTLTSTEYDWKDIVLVLIISWTGLYIGRRYIRLPVSHLLVPLLLTLLLTVTEVVSLSIPSWLQHTAQYMVGTALGSQFSGISRKLLMRCLGMGVICGLYLLFLAAAFAGILMHFVPASFGVIFVSFAAGGLAEMSLIAMSLNFNPIVVAVHHFIRLVLSVWIGVFFTRYLSKDQKSNS